MRQKAETLLTRSAMAAACDLIANALRKIQSMMVSRRLVLPLRPKIKRCREASTWRGAVLSMQMPPRERRWFCSRVRLRSYCTLLRLL